jgi:integrase
MSNTDRSRSEQGITPRHARTCRHRESRCTCSPTFQAQVWDARAEKRITKTFPTLAAARRWRQDAVVDVRRGDISGDRGPTVDEAAEDWLAAARAGVVRARGGRLFKPNTLRGYEQNLRLRVKPDLGHERLREVGLPELQRYVDRLAADGLAAGTIAMTIAPLRAIYGRAERLGQVKGNPTRGLALPAVRPRERTVVASDKIELVLATVAPGDRALWATAFYAGLRRGELYALRPEDVDLASGVIHVRRGWDAVEGEIDPKSARSRRRVPIPAALRDHLIERRLDTGGEAYVFGGAREARRMTERGSAAIKAAGFGALSIHDARHTYASLMIAAGVNAKALSEFMGHATIAITFDLYGHLLPGSHGEAAGLLDAFLARAAEAETDATTAAQAAAHPAESR